MTSKKQIEANRKNAKRSTGPISDNGKAVVARNATKHGILSQCIPVDDAEVNLYFEYCDAMWSELGPQGNLQAFLADRVISTAWRLRRVVHIETLMLKEAQRSYGITSYRDAFEGHSASNMAILSRYERSLENALFRALKEFKALKGDGELEVFSCSV